LLAQLRHLLIEDQSLHHQGYQDWALDQGHRLQALQRRS
jgi:hypothetical protein